MGKTKSRLSLGKKPWTVKRVKAVHVLQCQPDNSNKRNLQKRNLSPYKCMYKVSPAAKRIKTFRTPCRPKVNLLPKTSPVKSVKTPVKSVKISRSLFGPCQDNSEEGNLEPILDAPLPSNPLLDTETRRDDNIENSAKKVDENLLPEVLSVLSEEGGLDEVMMKFLKLVKERKFPLDNLAFLLWMEVVRWYDSQSTNQMRYSEKTKMFWKLGWRMFGGKFIHFMSGYKNREEIVLGLSAPGKTIPETSVINFAVPDVRSLRAFDRYDLFDNWRPGINENIMTVIGDNLGQSHKSACLTYDGKKIKQGLTDNCGDVDLIGYEPGLTIKQKQEELTNFIEEVSGFRRELNEFEKPATLTSLPESTKKDLRSLLLKLLKRISTFIIQAEELRRKKEYCKEKLIERSGNMDWRKGKYVYAISAMMAFLYDIEKFVENAEITREKVCIHLSFVNEAQYVQGKTLNLGENASHVELPDQYNNLEDENTRLIKQRTGKWFDIRKQAKVTGSTLYKALGFEGLQKQKDHFETVVCGVPEREHSETTKAAMKHGTENEQNGVATLVGKVIPVLYPGSIFFEEGCIEVFTNEMKPFLVVSPDGSLRGNDSFESTFAGIEIKCPVMKVHTDFPARYLLQCLSEIETLDVSSLVYISWTEEHSNVFRVERDSSLFQKAMKIAFTIYDDSSKKPTKLTDEQKDLKAEIVEKAKQVEFIGTFSSVKSGKDRTQYYSETVTVDDMMELLSDVNRQTSAHYELKRERASEAVVFIVADLDRSWDKEKIRCAPVAWFSKGYSLHTNTMRKIADDVHTLCHEHNIHIPCESFDGQWHGIVVKSRTEQPLTILQLQKDVWLQAEKTRKCDIISEVKKVNCDPKWAFVTVCRNGIQTRVICTVGPVTRVPTWRPEKKNREKNAEEPKVDNGSQINLTDVLPGCVANMETSSGVLTCTTVIDVVEKEAYATNVDEQAWMEELQLLDCEDQCETSTEDLAVDINRVNDTGEVELENRTKTVGATKAIEHAEHTVIQITPNDAERILSLFKSTKDCNKNQKWTNIDSSRLLEYFTSSARMISLLDIELRVIVKYLKKTKAVKIKETSSKHVKVEQLCKLLGLEFNPQQRTSVTKKRPIKTLKELAANAVSHIPKHELNIMYAEFIWPDRFTQWKKSAPNSLDTLVNNDSYKWFYLPEFSEKRQQLEVKCIDSTHLLTRTRRTICKGGIESITNEPWMKVAKTGKTFLTPIMIQEITDPMSTDMAVTHFTETVEELMHVNGDYLAAELCSDIRNWWEAEDRPGFSALERVGKRSGLRKRLLSYVDFSRFPPPGAHINGWPQQLWEALLANMDAKILLYPLCHGNTYNTRAFSSMIGETFFSELTSNDKRGQGTVTCEEFGRFICNSVEQLQMRLDPERSFAYSTKRSTVYRLVEDTDTDVSTGNEGNCHRCENKGMYLPENIVTRNHVFDSEGRKRLPGRRKQGTVSTGRNAVQRGTLGVRWEKARKNESKMLPTKKMGIE